MQQSWK
jgi:hypothetical protein